MDGRRSAISGLIQAGALVGPRLRTSLHPLQLSPAAGEVLRMLAVEPGLSCAYLARQLGVTRQSMYELIRTLVCRKLVTGLRRDEGPLAVWLTDEGLTTFKQLTALYDDAENRLFRCPDEQRLVLARLLQGCIEDLLFEGSPLAFAARR